MTVRRLKYCVNNEWKESKTTKYMPVTNSSTGEVMAEAPCCTVEEVNSAVAAAKEAFPGWSAKPIQQRTDFMFRFRTLAGCPSGRTDAVGFDGTGEEHRRGPGGHHQGHGGGGDGLRRADSDAGGRPDECLHRP